MLNSSGVQDGGLLEVNGDRVIDRRGDVFYRDKPREPDFIPTPSYDSDSRVGRKRGLLGRLLDRLIKSRPRLRGRGAMTVESCPLKSRQIPHLVLSPQFRATPQMPMRKRIRLPRAG